MSPHQAKSDPKTQDNGYIVARWYPNSAVLDIYRELEELFENEKIHIRNRRNIWGGNFYLMALLGPEFPEKMEKTLPVLRSAYPAGIDLGTGVGFLLIQEKKR